MQLHYREYGPADATPLLLLHGLFGSSGNWHSIARALQDRFRILVPDLRNHGRSPHDPGMDYASMAGDVLELLDASGLQSVYLVGHSMGGKAAMWLALHHPQRVRGLVPVDMAPVTYRHSFDNLLEALESVSLDGLSGRSQADRQLARQLDSPALRGYLLQNLLPSQGGWAWRINLPVLRKEMDHILGFPRMQAGTQYPGDTLFIHGGRSDYLSPEHAQAALGYFPHARMRMIPDAGHWVYSDAPEAFVSVLSGFLMS